MKVRNGVLLDLYLETRKALFYCGHVPLDARKASNKKRNWDRETGRILEKSDGGMTKLIDLYRHTRAKLFMAKEFVQWSGGISNDDPREISRVHENEKNRLKWDEETEENIRKAMS
jgi:hypothetical protein